jgi:hypothetical protein
MAPLDVATTGTLNGTATLVAAAAGDEGTGKIALKQNGTSNAVSTVVTNVFNGDLSTAGTIALLVDYGQDTDSQTCTGVDKRLGRSGTYQTQSGISNRSANKSTVGKRWEVMQASELANAIGIGAGQYDIRFQTSQVAAYARSPTIDALVRNADGPPIFMLRMDDARIDQVRSTDGIVSLAEQHCPELVPFMVSYVPVSTLGDSGTRMVQADLLNLKSRGVKIASNLTPDDNPITAYADTAAVMAAFQSQLATLTSMGLGGPDLYDTVASNGSFRTPGAEVQKTGLTTTVGSAVVPMSVTSDVAVGDVAIAVGLAAGTVVSAIDPGVSVTLSNPVTVASAFMTFIKTDGPFHTNKLKVAAAAVGIKSILSTNGGHIYVRGGLAEPDAYQLPFYSGSLATAASVIAIIDQAILRGCAMGFYLHVLDELLSSGLAMKPSEWVLVLQYLRAKYLAALIRFGTVRTIRETYGEGARWPLAA